MLKSLEEAISRGDLETVFSVWSAARGNKEFYAVKKLTDEKLDFLALENGIDVPVDSFRQLIYLYDGKNKLKQDIPSMFLLSEESYKDKFREVFDLIVGDRTSFLLNSAWELLISASKQKYTNPTRGNVLKFVFIALSLLEDTRSAVFLLESFLESNFAQHLTSFIFHYLLQSALLIYDERESPVTNHLSLIPNIENYATKVLDTLFAFQGKESIYAAALISYFHVALLSHALTDQTKNRVMLEYAQTTTVKEMVALHEKFFKELIFDQGIVDWLEEADIYDEMMDLLQPDVYGEDDLDEYY